MIDLKKPRLTENNKYTGEADCATPCCDVHKDCALGKNAEKGGCFYELVSRLNELENAIESGELVPVVRCKDCENWDKNRSLLSLHACSFWSSKNHFRFTEACDFCSCGAKMDGKDDEQDASK